MSEFVLQLMALQVGVPLVLIVLNATLPTASLAGLLLRSFAVALAIVYAALAGIWLFPPWWTPYVLGALHLVGVAIAFGRARGRLARRWGWLRWGELGAAVLGAGALAALLMPAIRGRAVPPEAVDLAMPLGPGTYLVTSGGTTGAINAHLATLNLERARDFRGQSFAVDLIGIDGLGLHANGIGPRDPGAYVIYGTEIRAPCSGEVLAATDGLPDMTVPEVDRANLTGNHVLLGCGDYVVVLAHMAPGSVMVAPGQGVAQGEPIGRVGNSGNTGEPHLHIHVQRGMPGDAPISGEPTWFTIEGRFLVRNDIVTVED